MATQIIQDQIVTKQNKFSKIDFSNLLSLETTHKILIWSLSLTFFWFGILKVLNMSPVVELLEKSFPFLAKPPFLELLGVFELCVAVGLLIPKIRKLTVLLMILHLLGTISVVCVSPNIIFAPYFPILTMEGEFIEKNFILISAGLVLINCRTSVKND